MGIRSVLSKPFASYVVGKQKKWAGEAGKTQQSIFQYLIQKAAHTKFGKDHNFSSIKIFILC